MRTLAGLLMLDTHAHPDHTGGAGVFAGNDHPEILAHRLFVDRVQHVALPPALAASPYLQEFYGTVAWSVRAIYADYAGWFDGNPAKLFPLPEKERAARVIDLAGGREAVLTRARRALADKDFQWAAELTDFVLASDEGNVEAKRLKAAALSELGERQISASARNYYLSAAQYLLRGLPAR